MRYPYDDFKNRIYKTTEFGEVVSYGFHDGVDLNAGAGDSDRGTPIHAIADGEVTSVHSHTTAPTFGNHIHYKIEGEWGIRYVHHAHCETIIKKVGDKVKEGEIIATMGNSGTKYAHDHMALKKEPTGIDGLATTEQRLKLWEDPVAFIEKYLPGQDDFGLVVKKATQWDETCNEYELGDPNHTLFEKLKQFVGGLRSRITDLDKQVAYEKTEKENRIEQLSRKEAELLEENKLRLEATDSLNKALKNLAGMQGSYEGQLAEKQKHIDDQGVVIGGLRHELAEAQAKQEFEKLFSFFGLTLYRKRVS